MADRLDTSNPRYWYQNARLAVQDVYDAIVELVTNADDAYIRRGTDKGRIDIEVERRRKGSPSVLRVRDFAGGIPSHEVDRKLGRLGDRRDSGLADGAAVRGTNSRGAKDVAVLGCATFESIDDSDSCTCRTITSHGEFRGKGLSERVNAGCRQRLGIPHGGGTLVTVEIDPSIAIKIPQHDNMVQRLSQLVPLREILHDPHREISLVDVTQNRKDRLRYHMPEGVERIKERLSIPGYPDAEAKLVICRARKPLEEGDKRFRQGGILIKSQRAVHEATFLAPELEHDPHAQWFFGFLRCEYIDRLWNEADERFESGQTPDEKNPRPILDPTRQSGLDRKHPFARALFAEALKHFRPLVDEERQREASDRARVESEDTRRRLNALERAAARFIEEFQEEEDESSDPDTPKVEGGFQRRGFGLNPPFAQLVVTQTQRFWLNISQKANPDLAVGSVVQIACESDHLSVDKPFCALELHPQRESVLRCIWQVRAQSATPTTGVTARVGGIVASAVIEVFASERDKYADIKELCFNRRTYRLQAGTSRRVRLLAPVPACISEPTPVEIRATHAAVRIAGDRILCPNERLGIAECQLRLTVKDPNLRATITAIAKGLQAEAEVITGPPPGESIQIKLEEDKDFGNSRSHWRGTVLEIYTRHPSLRRYLGSKAEGFPGQEKTQFRVLLAEIVAYSVAERILTRNAATNTADYREYDLEAYLAERDRLVTRFLPLAHETQVADPT